MSQPDAPLFSIITPVFNASATLDETLASVRAQTRTDWEHLLIDDASSDNSRALLEAAAAREQVASQAAEVRDRWAPAPAL